MRPSRSSSTNREPGASGVGLGPRGSAPRVPGLQGGAATRARASRERLGGALRVPRAIVTALLVVAQALLSGAQRRPAAAPGAWDQATPALGRELGPRGPRAQEAARPPASPGVASFCRPQVPKAGVSQVSAETFLGAVLSFFAFHWSLKSGHFLDLLKSWCSVGLWIFCPCRGPEGSINE